MEGGSALERINLEKWEESQENPQKLNYAGQREAQEVFAELKHRLESVGMLPDEYFLLDSQWENGREIEGTAIISRLPGLSRHEHARQGL